MLKPTQFQSSDSGPYSALYDILIPKDNFWRRLKENVDFSFITDIVAPKYTSDFGRAAIDPVFMFKLLLLKTAHKLSDRDLIHKVTVDMEMKFFLGLKPEQTEIIDPSLLSKFRTQRLPQDILLDDLIAKSVELALKKGVIKAKNVIIVDSTHSHARFQHISPREELLKRCKELRKAVYAHLPEMRDQMPSKKKANSGNTDEAVDYCKEVAEVIRKNDGLLGIPAVSERLNYLDEGIHETAQELIEYSKEQDARIGHKSADTSFFGFKTHLAVTPERIITAAVVTSGEKHDGKQLSTLIEKTEKNGIEVEATIGDGAYAEKDNLEMAKEKGIKIAAKLNDSVLHGNRKNGDKFEFNKDAGMYVCPEGHMAVRKCKSGQKKAKNGSNTQVELYFFDTEKCKHCLREGCYREGAKSKTYSVKIKSDIHLEQMDYMETDEYQELMRERYKVEAKNAELKQNYGYQNAVGCGFGAMRLQAGASIFLSNVHRIFKLMDEPREECAQKMAKKEQTNS